MRAGDGCSGGPLRAGVIAVRVPSWSSPRPRRNPRMIKTRLGVRAALVVAILTGVMAATASANFPVQAPTAPRGVDPASPTPLAGLRFYVDHGEPAFRQFRRYRHRGQRGRAALMWRIASQPR